jgi:hypothetical protein
VSAAVVLSAALAIPAGAHLALVSPPSRYGESVLKEGPCGVAGGARSERVTALEPGARLEVVWDEYIDHPGHYRIAFDPDGDDDFVDPQCLAGCNTRTPAIETYSNGTVLLDAIPDTPQGGRGSALVTLPDIECSRCTLQVIQVMYDKPPYTRGGDDIYYQCVDLLLRRAPGDRCPGDCDGDGRVTVAELVAGVRAVLGEDPLSTCDAVDSDRDTRATVDDLVRAVQAALYDCDASP